METGIQGVGKRPRNLADADAGHSRRHHGDAETSQQGNQSKQRDAAGQSPVERRENIL
jgi:hypothetical protein